MNTSIKKLDDGRQTESMTSLFLSQSYQDAWDDYARSLKKEGFARWDYTNIVTRTHKELDLIRQDAVEAFFAEEKPDYV